jgi:hypothetical protein
MPERRKSPRYTVHLPIYLLEYDRWAYTSDISMDGCYFAVDAPLSVGHITDFLMEFPVVGVIQLKGYVQHQEGQRSGLGVQLLQTRFSTDQSGYYDLYMNVLKLMPKLEEIRGRYLDMADHGRLKLCEFPGPPPGSIRLDV